MLFFWHTISPEGNAFACFGFSHLILMNGRLYLFFLISYVLASAWLILLKSSSSLKSFIVMLLDTPLNTKNLLFEAFAE